MGREVAFAVAVAVPGGRKQEAVSRKQEAGSRRQEAVGRRQSAGGRWQVAGGINQQAGCSRISAHGFIRGIIQNTITKVNGFSRFFKSSLKAVSPSPNGEGAGG